MIILVEWHKAQHSLAGEDFWHNRRVALKILEVCPADADVNHPATRKEKNSPRHFFCRKIVSMQMRPQNSCARCCGSSNWAGRRQNALVATFGPDRELCTAENFNRAQLRMPITITSRELHPKWSYHHPRATECCRPMDFCFSPVCFYFWAQFWESKRRMEIQWALFPFSDDDGDGSTW